MILRLFLFVTFSLPLLCSGQQIYWASKVVEPNDVNGKQNYVDGIERSEEIRSVSVKPNLASGVHFAGKARRTDDETRPVTSNVTTESHKQNRKVEFTIIKI